MKKLKLLATGLLFCLFANNLAAQIQQIKIVNFNVKNQLPAIVDSWMSTPAALILTAQKQPGTQVREPMMVLQIRSGSAIICGNTMATAKRIDPFDVRVFNTADLLGLLGNCHELKAGTYTICVQFFNIDKVAISQEVCKDFRVEDTNVEYSPPTLITPDNGKKFTAQELQSVVTFRWTPLVPKPKEPVTYRLKVWQLMQGQNGTTAMRTNQPIVTKDVDNITQATVSGIYTGPCRPPYLCDYIWQVQALNRSGKPMGNNNGMSEPYTFGLAEEKSKCPANLFPEDKKKYTSEEAKKEMLFRWTPVVPKPQEPVTYRLKVWQLMQGQNAATAMRTNQPIVTKDVADITEATMNGIYTGPCRPPYLCDFVWVVEMRNAAGQTSCTSEPTTFSVTEENIKCPTNTFPEDKKKLTPEEAKKEMTFRWTPVVPKPQSAVTYRLKVWQLMQGQNSTEAMRTNKPIVTKDVADITEATVSGIYTGPCRPPYLCDYVWMVEAVSKNGSTSCASEPSSFSVTEWQITGPGNTFPEDKKEFTSADAIKGVTFRWTPVVPKPQEPVTYRMKVWQLMQGQNSTQAMRTNKPIVTKDVADITEAFVVGIYTGPCRPPYLCNYIWEVQAVTRTGTILGTSNPTEFNIKETKITGPENTFPEDKKEFISDEAKNAVTFRWTPIVPKPQEPVTYRLRVWQLMQGQNSTQAMRSNQPIVTKDVLDITEATVSNLYTGPCRPPYLCDFIWDVQALIGNGMNAGTSKPTEFSIKESKITGPENTFPEDKKEFKPDEVKQTVTFRWTPVVPKPQESVTYRLKVWQLMQGQSSSQAMRTNKPIVTKDVADITEATVSGIYTGPCKPPYLCDYIWEVQAVTRTGTTAGTSHPTEFSVKESQLTGPDNTFPEDKKEFKPDEVKQTVTFRWTPVVPKPQESVTYRLKVWQLMQGQSSSQAMRTNKPIVTKDVADITEATVSGIYTGPCRPPYLCDYIWNVEAITRQAGAAEKIIGTSEPTIFAVSNCDVNLSLKLKSVECLKSENGFNIYRICVASTYISPVYQLTYFNTGSGFSAYHPSYTPTYTVSNVTPVLQVQNTGPSTTVNYCVDVSVPIGQNIIKLGLQGDDKDPGPIVCQPGAELDIDLPPCKCNACDSVKINVVQKDLKFDASGNIILNTTISASPKPVISIKTELVYFEYKPESDDCMLCNKDSKNYGNFNNGIHTIEWNFTPPKNLNNGEPANMIINVPPTVNCCNANIRWCIRFVVTFGDCTVCNKLVCYEIKKDGCANENQNPKTGQK